MYEKYNFHFKRSTLKNCFHAQKKRQLQLTQPMTVKVNQKTKKKKKKNLAARRKNYLYVLEGKGNKITYTGISANLQERIKKHNSKSGSRFTRKHQPWRMVAYITGFKSRRDVLSLESITKKKRANNVYASKHIQHRVLFNRLHHIIQVADAWMT